MSSMIGKSTGIALLMAAALLAALFAMGVFSATGVGADVVADDPLTTDVNEGPTVELTDYTTGATGVEMKVTFQVAADVADGTEITFTVTGADGQFDFPTIVGTNNGDPLPEELSITQGGVDYPLAQVNVDATAVDNETITIQVTSEASTPAIPGEMQIEADEDIVITIGGMINPATRGPQTITVNDGGATAATVNVDIYDVNMATTGNEAGSNQRLTISAPLDAVPHGGAIRLHMSSFGDLDGIEKGDVTINDANPSDVDVSGSTVTLYWDDADDTNGPLGITSDTVIIVRKGAGVTLPIRAGSYEIGVSTDETDADATAALVRNRVTVVRTVKVDPTSATRGSEIMVSGSGFSDGTAAIKINEIDQFMTTEVDGGTFSVPVDTAAKSNNVAVFDAGNNTINANDAVGESATAVNFEITPSFSVSPENPLSGADITITLDDIDVGDMVPMVSFAGDAAVAAVGPDSDGDWEATVPSDARIGTIQVKIEIGDDVTLTQNITIGTNDLMVTPSTVVPRQEISIDGSGFNDDIPASTQDDDGMVTLSNVMVGDAMAMNSEQLVNNNGDISFNIMVPDDVVPGTRMVMVTDGGGRVGVAEITVAEAEVMLEPAESLVGSEVMVTGTGFPANDLVLIDYGASTVATAATSSIGEFQQMIIVPSGESIGPGGSSDVTATSQVNDVDVSASADHKRPDTEIMLMPSMATAGQMIDIQGMNFGGFLQVYRIMIGGQNVTPVPAPSTDKWGAFMANNVQVPQLTPGRYAVKVTVASEDGDSATEFLEVVVEAASSAPMDVFADLIASERLSRVWYLDAANQEWTFYDPAPEFADFNDLTSVSSGDVVTIIVSEGDTMMFQGRTLYPGTNLVPLR